MLLGVVVVVVVVITSLKTGGLQHENKLFSIMFSILDSCAEKSKKTALSSVYVLNCMDTQIVNSYRSQL